MSSTSTVVEYMVGQDFYSVYVYILSILRGEMNRDC